MTKQQVPITSVVVEVRIAEPKDAKRKRLVEVYRDPLFRGVVLATAPRMKARFLYCLFDRFELVRESPHLKLLFHPVLVLSRVVRS